MRKIPLSRSLLHFLDQTESIEAALSAHPDTQTLAPPFQQLILDWDTHFKNERQSRRSVIRSNAVVAVRNQQLDIPTTKLGHLLRALLPALFNKIFDLAPGRFIRRGLRIQAERTLTVIVPELSKLPADHAASPMAAELKGYAQNAITALDARVQAKGDRTVTRNSIDEYKEDVNALILSTYGELLVTAAEKGYPKSWADAFFPSSESDVDPDAGEAGASEASEPPAP